MFFINLEVSFNCRGTVSEDISTLPRKLDSHASERQMLWFTFELMEKYLTPRNKSRATREKKMGDNRVKQFQLFASVDSDVSIVS